MIRYEYVINDVGPRGQLINISTYHKTLYGLLSCINHEAAVLWDKLEYIIPEATDLIQLINYDARRVGDQRLFMDLNIFYTEIKSDIYTRYRESLVWNQRQLKWINCGGAYWQEWHP
jgi:hypothetical protein